MREKIIASSPAPTSNAQAYPQDQAEVLPKWKADIKYVCHDSEATTPIRSLEHYTISFKTYQNHLYRSDPSFHVVKTHLAVRKQKVRL